MDVRLNRMPPVSSDQGPIMVAQKYLQQQKTSPYSSSSDFSNLLEQVSCTPEKKTRQSVEVSLI